MRKILLFLALAALAGCNDDDGHSPANQKVLEAFQAKYPNASNTRWGGQQGFAVASFQEPQAGNVLYDSEAWFGTNGTWYMTVSDIPYAALPEAVKGAFSASDYANWYIDEVDKVERASAATLYIIEVETRGSKPEQEWDLYYTEDGTLVKTVPSDGPPAYSPVAPNGSVEEYIATEYPDATILDFEREGGITEVDILDGGVVRELYFDAAGAWLRTETELRVAELPDAVRQAIAASEYASWQIDDVTNIIEGAGEFYLIELESGEREVVLRISPSGVIL